MQLAYTADWVPHPVNGCTLQIGIYLASVANNQGIHHWCVDADRGDRPPFAGGQEDSEEAAQAAAETAIREHHTDSHR